MITSYSLKRCLPLLLAGILAGAIPALADGIEYYATGDQMAGGLLTVLFAISGPVGAPIVAAAGNTGSATAPGMYAFSVSGDTFANPWSLINLSTFDTILSANFNLHGSISVFDTTDPNPGTINSASGRSGAVQIGPPPPTITGSAEWDPWLNPTNLGDIYWQEEINWGLGDFGPGLTSQWDDDTDYIVPEPATFVLLGAAVAMAGLWRRRRLS
jgi:hypothetical protein